MYVLSSLGEPFAIVENNINMRIERAIAEEFSLTEVGLMLDEDFRLPDWGEDSYIDYTGTDEDNFEVTGNVLITKLVNY